MPAIECIITLAMPLKVNLREFTSDDLPRLEAWVSDGDVKRYMSRWTPRSLMNGRWSPHLVRWWVIVAGENEVGVLWIEKADTDDSVADLGILIGEPEMRGHGVGQAAIRLAEADAGARWHIERERIRLRVRKTNERAVCCYRKLGYVVSSVTEKEIENGTRIDVLEMTHLLKNPDEA